MLRKKMAFFHISGLRTKLQSSRDLQSTHLSRIDQLKKEISHQGMAVCGSKLNEFSENTRFFHKTAIFFFFRSSYCFSLFYFFFILSVSQLMGCVCELHANLNQKSANTYLDLCTGNKAPIALHVY